MIRIMAHFDIVRRTTDLHCTRQNTKCVHVLIAVCPNYLRDNRRSIICLIDRWTEWAREYYYSLKVNFGDYALEVLLTIHNIMLFQQ